jgi:ligand-binding sensor domain-containing protein
MLRAIDVLFEGIKQGCRRSRIRILLLLLLFAPSAFCRYSFDSWTVDNGLPVNSILGIVRGRDGYIWLLTSAGLVRFDGLNFQLFDHSNIPGLATGEFSDFFAQRR